MRLPTAALLAALLVAPGTVRADDSWGLSLQLLWGVSRYDVGGLEAGIASQGTDMLQDSASMTGGIGLLRLGVLDLGVVYEGGIHLRHRRQRGADAGGRPRPSAR